MVSHLDLSKLDHIPLPLQLPRAWPQQQRWRNTFMFEEFWANYDECESVIYEAWSNQFIGVPMFSVFQKIKVIQFAILKWS